ncbi:MAG TPA: S8 family serine peptidase [Acidimicrobiia bacterium]
MSLSKATRRKTSIGVLAALAAFAIAVAGFVVGNLARSGTSNTFENTAATYPGPSDTGVPAGVALTPYTGPTTITTCGSVIEAKTVDGSLIIRAGNGHSDANHPCVTIRDSLIKGSIDSSTATSAACRPSPCGPVAIYDSEIAVPQPNAGDFAAVSQTNLHAWRIDVHGARSGIQCDGNCEVHDSYVVADYFVSPARMDAYVATSASSGTQVLDHNTFLCYIGPGSPGRPNPRDVKGGCSGDVAFFGTVGKISNVTVDDNLFRASGAQRYAAYTGASAPHRAYPLGDHLTWTANVFQQCPTAPAKGSCSTSGPVPDWASSATNQWCRNAWDTGALVLASVENCPGHSGASTVPVTVASGIGDSPATSARPAKPGDARRWSVVRQRDGHLMVVRGVQAANLRPAAVIAPLDARVLSVETDGPEGALVTAGENDPLRPRQWALDQTSFEQAWSATRGSGVTVAIVDSGVDAAHEDLGAVVLPGIDYIDSGRDGRYDPNGHGTHVAGIVAATVNNGLGIAGAAPGVRILPVRVLDASGNGLSSNVAAGIVWAADHGARVISMSLGGGPSAGIQIAMRYALDKGAVVLAAAGNNGATGNAAVYPAAYPEAIAVGAFDENLARSAFSNTASYVDVSAPGSDIWSTWSSSSNSYAVASGTSMATPYASAEAALIISENNTLSAGAVTSILESTARDAGAPGVDPEFGHGLIDPAAAVVAATPRIAGYGSKGNGYWIVGPDGSVRAFGRAQFYGDVQQSGGAFPGGIVASARTPTGGGYWLAAANGAVLAFGDAHYYGGMNQVALNSPIVGMASTPSGQGYILLGADGGIFTFGDAQFHGSTGGMRLNARVLDLAITASGNGYWFVAADGGVFSFGDAQFHGSTGSMRLAAPVMSIAGAHDGSGYWLVASDGGIFAFGVPFEGSLPGLRAILGGTYVPTMRMRAISSKDGYYLLGLDGSIEAFGTARFFGSASPSGSIDLMLAP